jgi:hypothetical protein
MAFWFGHRNPQTLHTVDAKHQVPVASSSKQSEAEVPSFKQVERATRRSPFSNTAVGDRGKTMELVDD